MSDPVVLCWSGGKDSALALHALRADARLDVKALLTTVNEGFDRISMHGVRRSLLHRQAESLGLPLREVFVPPWPSNDAYQIRMGEAFDGFHAQGIRRVAFGDIFLEDLRAWRERLLAPHGLIGHYPIWGRDTRALFAVFCDLGFKAVTVCVSQPQLDAAFLGRELDPDFLADLPAGVDPCGENGEYHSFVYDGPPFREPIPFRLGRTVSRDSLLFRDLLSEADRPEDDQEPNPPLAGATNTEDAICPITATTTPCPIHTKT